MNEKGFSLVELLVAMLVASFVGLAGVMVFTTGNRFYKAQEAVGEAQQNARVAMERLAKDIRMAGFGLPDPPFSLDFSGLSSTPTSLPNPLTSPITVSNSVSGTGMDSRLIGTDSITILGIGYEAGTLRKGINTDCNDSGKSLICLDNNSVTKYFFTGSGTYAYQPNRRYISLNGTTFIELAITQTDANRAVDKLALLNPAALARNYPDGTPVYIIQAINYSIDTDSALDGCSPSNPCLVSRDYAMLRGGTTPGGRQIVAENIEDIQFAYGIDASPKDGKIDYTGTYSDATAFYFSAGGPTVLLDPSNIIAVKTSVVGRTRDPDQSGGSFTHPALEDHASGTPDGYRRRVLTKVIKLRNPRQGGY